MSHSKYTPMSGLEFGQQLCLTGDLDPVYTYALALPLAQRRRFVFAYLMFYHAGIATLLSMCETIGEFAEVFAKICRQTGGARGGERRHFRGKATYAVMSDLNWNRGHYGWNAIFGGEVDVPLSGSNTVVACPSFDSAYKAALMYPSVGSWLAFKTADMVERCDLLHPCADGVWQQGDANQCTPFWYEQPRKGLQLMRGDWVVNGKLSTEHYEYRDSLLGILRTMRVVPCGIQNRQLNQQEVETICCKYKSHLKGTYPIGKDIGHLYAQLGTEWLDKEPSVWLGDRATHASDILFTHRELARGVINARDKSRGNV